MQKFRVVSQQFSYPMYAANAVKGLQWTDRVDEAEVYDERDSRPTKLLWWRAMAERNGLDPTKVQIVEAA